MYLIGSDIYKHKLIMVRIYEPCYKVMLEEDPDLQLPFLLPEDGYTSDVLRGVPAGLHDFIEPLQARVTIFSSGNMSCYVDFKEENYVCFA